MKSSKFKIHELVPIRLYNTVHEDVLWQMLDDRLLETIDKIKELLPKGTMVINSYHWGGDRGWSGLRTTDSKWYKEGSMHSVGKAVDFVCSEYSADEVRVIIMENLDILTHIKGLELDVSWVHIDVRDSDELITFTA